MQQNATTRDSAQASHVTATKPYRSSPHLRYRSTSSFTRGGIELDTSGQPRRKASCSTDFPGAGRRSSTPSPTRFVSCPGTVELDLAPPARVDALRISDDVNRPTFTQCVTTAMRGVRFAALDEEISVHVPYVLSPERKYPQPPLLSPSRGEGRPDTVPRMNARGRLV
ncbi:MAG: hypothetical protein Q8K32_31935 [Archangium sp.]|nr:hypothetical protein [Archangium sp.]